MRLKFVIFGLSMSSSWGNGHATLWRGLARALASLGHEVVFFERDLPYYAHHRDLIEPDYCRLVLYQTWEHIEKQARMELTGADVGMVTSYCPDALLASSLLFDSKADLKLFYDLDTPVTLSLLDSAQGCPYIGEDGLRQFDWVLSFTGGRALIELSSKLGAKRALPLFGWVDPSVHCPTAATSEYSAQLSYLGTYAEDRRECLELLLCEPARRLRNDRFTLAGSLYPPDFEVPDNVTRINHVAPPQHASFFCSSRFTVNVTRQAMKNYGCCPSGRLFEAAACGTAIISDAWDDMESFFEPQREILVARSTDDVLSALRLPEATRHYIGEAARQRTLAEHSAIARANTLIAYIFDSSPRKTNPSSSGFHSEPRVLEIVRGGASNTACKRTPGEV